MIGIAIDIIFGLLPWVIGVYLLFPGLFKSITDNINKQIAAVNKRRYDAFVLSEMQRRKELLAEMKRLGYDRDAATAKEVDRMYELFAEEFPVLYEDKE